MGISSLRSSLGLWVANQRQAYINWPTISLVIKFLLRPWVPVKQKEQFMAQPTCDDRQIEYLL